MEELCYQLKENAFLLDLSLLSDKLLKWISEQCGMKELAGNLHALVHKKGSLSAFVLTILEECGFYDEETLARTEQVLKQGAGLSSMEKRKKQIDYLVERRKYMLAVKEYTQLLAYWNAQKQAGAVLPAMACYAGILHNKGVAYAGLMRYQDAAKSFFEAWQMDADEKSYKAYLAASRLYLDELDYVAFVEQQQEKYGIALALEKELDEIITNWESHPDYLFVCNMEETKDEKACERMLRAMKDGYRTV
jgi:tetratricopeptide (TPR) repeat protein